MAFAIGILPSQNNVVVGESKAIVLQLTDVPVEGVTLQLVSDDATVLQFEGGQTSEEVAAGTTELTLNVEGLQLGQATITVSDNISGANDSMLLTVSSASQNFWEFEESSDCQCFTFLFSAGDSFWQGVDSDDVALAMKDPVVADALNQIVEETSGLLVAAIRSV